MKYRTIDIDIYGAPKVKLRAHRLNVNNLSKITPFLDLNKIIIYIIVMI